MRSPPPVALSRHRFEARFVPAYCKKKLTSADWADDWGDEEALSTLRAIGHTHPPQETAMATRRKGNDNSRRSSKTQRGGNGRRSDAIVLLEADHRQVEGWFEQFKKSRLRAKKAELAEFIGDALRIHSQIEEEIFYPAVLEATGEQDVHHEELGERLRERKGQLQAGARDDRLQVANGSQQARLR
jgi:hypothetical protein